MARTVTSALVLIVWMLPWCGSRHSNELGCRLCSAWNPRFMLSHATEEMWRVPSQVGIPAVPTLAVHSCVVFHLNHTVFAHTRPLKDKTCVFSNIGQVIRLPLCL